MKVLGWETPNEVWYREPGKVMSRTSHPKTSSVDDILFY